MGLKLSSYYLRSLLSLIILSLLVLGFQNCTQSRFSNNNNSSEIQQSGNADGYSGKQQLFNFMDSANPCSQLDRQSKPLPNTQIFFQEKAGSTSMAPYLVREKCQDIQPSELSPAQVEVSGGGTQLTYAGQTFNQLVIESDFNVVASACPAGKSLIPNAVRTNLLGSSLNWMIRPPWMWHNGISVALNGSIQSLPSYQILRTDPNYLQGYERASQFAQLGASRDYVVSFLARSGTTQAATLRIHRFAATTAQDELLTVDFSFSNGTSSVRVNENLAPVTVSMVPVSNGYFCSVYFRTSTSGDQGETELGVAPMDVDYLPNVGDSIIATAFQLEGIDGYCQ